MNDRRVYDILGINPPKFHPATYSNNTIDTGDHLFDVTKYLARGENGIVFATKTYVVKLEQQNVPNLVEIDITQFASHKRIGPLVWIRGKLNIQLEELQELANRVEREGFFHPWGDNVLHTPGFPFWYSVTERWDTSLGSYLEKMDGGVIQAFFNLEPSVIQKLINLVDQMHKAKLVHFDLHFENILINLENGVIVDVVLTDFGASLARSQYFYSTSDFVRDRRALAMSERKMLTQLANSIATIGPKLRGQTPLYKWLKNEPFNMDLASFQAYALRHPSVVFENLPKLVMPEEYRFELQWAPGDMIRNVPILIDGNETGVTTEIFGKMKLEQLRRLVTKKLPSIVDKLFVYGEKSDGSLVDQSLEATLTSRAVPVKLGDRVFIEFKTTN